MMEVFKNGFYNEDFSKRWCSSSVDELKQKFSKMPTSLYFELSQCRKSAIDQSLMTQTDVVLSFLWSKTLRKRQCARKTIYAFQKRVSGQFPDVFSFFYEMFLIGYFLLYAPLPMNKNLLRLKAQKYNKCKKSENLASLESFFVSNGV